jgi:hypothetical protein
MIGGRFIGFGRIALAVLLLCTLGTAIAADHSAVVGAWRIRGTDEQGGARAAALYITEKDGELAGRWNTRGGSVELRDVVFENEKLSFWWYVDIQSSLIKMRVALDVKDDMLEGTLKEPHATGNISGERFRVKSGDDEQTEQDAKPAE